MTIKKISALLMLSVLPLGVLTAQEGNQKDYLPKAGDLAIGIDMQPVYRFFGNLANGNVANNLGDFGGEQAINDAGLNASINHTIMGKYMLDNTTALRLNLGLGKTVNNNYEYTPDQKEQFLNPFSEANVIDHQRINRAAYSVAAGIEFRRGKDRIQGFAGADLLFAMDKTKYVYEWGNAITEINQVPGHNDNFTYAAGFPYHTTNAPYLGQSERIKEHYTNSVFAGIAGRVGVEYFVAPKLAFGGEVSLAVYEKIDRLSYAISEGYNASTLEVEQYTELKKPNNRSFTLKTDDLGGKLFMIFYF